MRHVTRRLSAALFALWFALYMGAPGLVHPCPEHSAPGASVAVGEGAHGDHGSTSLADAGQSSDTPSDGHGCCCPGPQCGAGAMVLAEAPTIAGAALTPQVAPDFRAPERAFGARPEHLLPYSTAPPTSLA